MELTDSEKTTCFTDDGRILPEVGEWAKLKHRKIAYYASLFSQSMKGKWDCLVCIDLFAGAGMAVTKRSKMIIPGSPLVTLGIENPFSRYIFCEADSLRAEALRARIDARFPAIEAIVINEDANIGVNQVLSVVPQFDHTHKGLTLCFVDPYKAAQLHFETLTQISRRLYVDFVVLIPSFMDIHRNQKNYTREDNNTLDKFLGTNSWRGEWAIASRRAFDFGIFIADYFGKQMAKLGYIYSSVDDYEVMRVEEGRSLYLYHLGFFSKNKLGVKFWKETKKGTRVQGQLF